MPELIVVQGDREVGSYALEERELRIGRGEENDVVLPSAKVSRAHARLALQDGAWHFQDLGSANGSFLGEGRVHERMLVDGDRIRIADFHLVYRAGDARLLGSRPGEVVAQAGHDLGTLLRSTLHEDAPRAARDEVERLQALFEISSVLDGASGYETVLVEVLDRAVAIMGAERGYLFLRDPATGRLAVAVARSAARRDLEGAEREAVSRRLVERVVAERRSMLVRDAQASSEWTSASVLAHSIHSAVVAPLTSAQQTTGALYVDHRSRPRAFDERDLAFFTILAAQARATIDSSRAYWELVDNLFRASDDVVLIGSPEGAVRSANAAAARLLGRPAAELAGLPFASLVAPADRDAALALAREAISAGVAPAREVRLLAADGRSVPASAASFAMRDRSGAAIGQCLIARDLSEVRGLIDQLELRNRFIQDVFGRYLSDDVVERLLRSPAALEVGGEKRRVTVMMSDLRGFTPHAERLPPEQVVTLLNHYLGTMTEIILRHGGTIDEFLGDAILVIFGAPESRPDDALRACTCAVEMQLAMPAVNAWNREHGLPAIEMGIGINTGDAVVGNIGSARRLKYGVVGRVVNLASRIESTTVGGQVLVAHSTLEAAGGLVAARDPIDLHLKGVEGALRVFELAAVAVEGGGSAGFRRLAGSREELRPLPRPVAVKLARLDGKTVAEGLADAAIVALGRRQAEIAAATPPEAMANLRLSVLPVAGGPSYGDVYGKVLTDEDAPAGRFRVHFTSVPPEVEALLDGLKSQTLPGGGEGRR